MESALAVFKLLRLCVSPAIGQRRAVALSVGLELTGIGFVTLSPFLLKQLIDRLSASHGTSLDLWFFVLAFVVAWAASGPISSVRATQSTRVTAAVSRRLTEGALRAVLPRSVRERDSDSSRLTGLLERLPFSLMIVMDGLIWSSLPLCLQLILSLTIAAGVLPPAEIVALGVVLAAFASVSYLGAMWHQKVAFASNGAASHASHVLGDIVRNGRRVVLNGNLNNEICDLDIAMLEKGRQQTQSAWSLASMSGLQFAVVVLGLVVLLGLAVRDVESKTMTLGGLILLQAYAMRMIMPLGSFGFIFSHAGEALANLAEVFRAQGPTAIPEAERVVSLQAPTSAIVEVSDLHFRYAAGASGIEGVSASFPPGSITAVVGANGSGKSTFAQLLAGIFNPVTGRVMINGVDLQSVDPAQRHHWVLYVPQMVSLFNRTLGENALYPPTTLSIDDLQARLTTWGFYDSGRLVDLALSVGEQGEKLSGGQIQKLELARISGVRSPLVILDESTSALDPAGEIMVIEDLKRTFVGRASLVLITHRPASAAISDQVIWLAAGRVAAIGAHAELMRSSAGYRRLWMAENAEAMSV